jgi:hypothetical protein
LAPYVASHVTNAIRCREVLDIAEASRRIANPMRYFSLSQKITETKREKIRLISTLFQRQPQKLEFELQYQIQGIHESKFHSAPLRTGSGGVAAVKKRREASIDLEILRGSPFSVRPLNYSESELKTAGALPLTVVWLFVPNGEAP